MNVLEMAIAIKGKIDGSFSASTREAIAEAQELSKAISRVNNEIRAQSKAANIAAKGGGAPVGEYQRLAALQSRVTQMKERQLAITDAITKREAAYSNLASAGANFYAAAQGIMAVGGALASSINSAIAFESAMADVKKVVDFDTPEQFKKMNADVLKLSGRLPMAAEGIAAIVAAGGQSGIARDELVAFAESAAKMGVAFDITADQAGDMMAKWRTAFKMGQTDVIALADKVNYLGNTTAASAPLISDVVTRIGPLGEVGGLASGEIAAMGASLVGAGIQSEVAATGIKNLILSLVSGESATKSQAAAFEALGMDAVELSRRMQTDAKGAILDVLKSVKSLDAASQASTLQQLFGKESLSAIAPLLSNLEGLEENFNKVTDASQYAGSMEAEYAARAATTENSLQLLKNNVSAIATGIGSALLPAINDTLQAVAPMVSAFADWAAENPGIIKGIIGLAAVMASLNVVFHGWKLAGAAADVFSASMKAAATENVGLLAKLGNGFLAFKGVIADAFASAKAVITGGFSAIVGAARNIFSTGLTGAVKNAFTAIRAIMAANPLGLALLALSAAIAVVVANWDKFKETASIVWNHVSGTIGAAVSVISSVFGGLMEKFSAVWSKITGESTESSEIVAAVFNNLGFAVNVAFDLMMGVITTAVQAIGGLLGGLLETLGGVIDFVAGVFTGDWERAWNGIKDIFTGVIDAIRGVFRGFADGISSTLNYLMGRADDVKAKTDNARDESHVPKRARGGIFSAPQLSVIAEAGPEAIVPLTRSAHSFSLWRQAGQALGAMPQVPEIPAMNANRNISISFSPVVNVAGGGNAGADIEAALRRAKAEFEANLPRLLKECAAQERRVSFA